MKLSVETLKLVQMARDEYYQENHPHFNNKTSCNMTEIF